MLVLQVVLIMTVSLQERASFVVGFFAFHCSLPARWNHGDQERGQIFLILIGREWEQDDLANDHQRVQKSTNVAQQVQQAVSLSAELLQVFVQVDLKTGELIPS